MTLSQFLFRNRSYAPIPFLLVMVVFARPEWWSLAAGFVVALAGEAVRAWGVFYAGSETRVTGEVGASRLVTSGPFSYVRNPLYLGNMGLYLGIGLMSLALFPWLQLGAAAWFLFQYTMIVREEERFLRGEFGDAYVEYCASVPRFVPRFTPWRAGAPVRVDWRGGMRSERRTLQAFALVTLILIAIRLVR